MKKDMDKLFAKFADAIERIDTAKLFEQAVRETKDLALDLNRSQMYDAGVNPAGQRIGEYTEATKRIKQKKGQRTDHMTLSDTFSFYDKMFIEAEENEIFIDSRDSKTGMLVQKYGNVFGLTLENLKTYSEVVRKVYKDKMDKAIEDKAKILR
jgi:hypothetical protein